MLSRETNTSVNKINLVVKEGLQTEIKSLTADDVQKARENPQQNNIVLETLEKAKGSINEGTSSDDQNEGQELFDLSLAIGN